MDIHEAPSPRIRAMIVLVAFAFACAGGPQRAVEPAARAAEPAAPRKVTLWSFAQFGTEEYLRRKADVDRKFGVDLVVEVVPQDAFLKRLQTAFDDGNGVPDVIEWTIEYNGVLSADPRRSAVLPLDQYVEKSAVFQNVAPARAAWVTYGGHVYGLPHDVYPAVLVYNDTLWRSVGVDLAEIETWDEFFEAAKKLTAEQRNGVPAHYALPSGNAGLADTMFMIWQQTGAQLLDPDGKPRFTSKEFAGYVRDWLRWYRTGAFGPWEWGRFKAVLASGKLCSYVSPDWWVPQVNLAATGSDGDSTVAVKYQWRVRPLPAYRRGGTTSASWGGSFMAIPKGTKDPALVYAVMEYLQYDPSTLEERWSTTSMLPPRTDLWSDPVFDRADRRFGGQKLGRVLVAAGRNMPRIETGDVFWDARNLFNDRFGDIESGQVTVEDGLEQVQDAAMARYEQLMK
jgi:ABC-type glycerol-3-phosphate transport system substrate-binding protein